MPELSGVRAFVLPPGSPVRRANIEALARRGDDPAVRDTAAGKYDRMLAIPIDDGDLQILTGRRGANSMPHDASVSAGSDDAAGLCPHRFRCTRGTPEMVDAAQDGKGLRVRTSP